MRGEDGGAGEREEIAAAGTGEGGAGEREEEKTGVLGAGVREELSDGW